MKEKEFIIDLSYKDARKFFLKNETYFTLDLPKYFTFSVQYENDNKNLNPDSFPKLLECLSKKIGDNNLLDDKNKINIKVLKSAENINYKLFVPKGSNHDWRLIQLIHPLIYVALVNLLTTQGNWNFIKRKFKEFKKGSDVKCISLPVVNLEKEESNIKKQINFWWKNVEQASIELSLDYDYTYHLDIANFYSSIYTHSITWALHGKTIIKNLLKEKKKENKKDLSKKLGHQIDRFLQNMSFGQTNGIPEGSVLMDFIAEMLLGHLDIKLTKELKNEELKNEELKNGKNYEILRYRDDYRLFVNNPKIVEVITKKLSEVLAGFGLRLNTNKIAKSNDVIRASIKPDKWYRKVYYDNHYNYDNHLKKATAYNQMLFLKNFYDKYPNSTNGIKIMSNINKIIRRRKKKNKPIMTLISFMVDIAYKNNDIYVWVVAISIINNLVLLLEEDKRKDVIDKIQKKFNKLPNNGFFEIWMQRMTRKNNMNIKYKEKLCALKKTDKKLWDSSWVKDKRIQNKIHKVMIYDKNIMKELEPQIKDKEIDIFEKGKPFNYE